MPRAIEPLAYYVAQTSCDQRDKPGTLKLRALILNTYRGTWMGMHYPCGTNGRVSEHYEGRALDWGVSVRNATQYAYARAFMSWLFATDRYGHRLALARRLGIQYLIYNGRMWGAWSGTWEQYNGCSTKTARSYDNYCHRDHMHISLSWNGAMGGTTFWTGRITGFDYGPCRPRDLNWAANRTRWNLSQCPRYPTVNASAAASALKKDLVRYSGAGIHLGSSGPIVVAVQRALHVSPSGYYGLTTRRAVVAFQHRHGILGTGGMSPSTWRHLLPVVH